MPGKQLSAQGGCSLSLRGLLLSCVSHYRRIPDCFSLSRAPLCSLPYFPTQYPAALCWTYAVCWDIRHSCWFDQGSWDQGGKGLLVTSLELSVPLSNVLENQMVTRGEGQSHQPFSFPTSSLLLVFIRTPGYRKGMYHQPHSSRQPMV